MKSILSKFSLAAGWDLLARLTDTMRSFANKAAASSDRSKAASVGGFFHLFKRLRCLFLGTLRTCRDVRLKSVIARIADTDESPRQATPTPAGAVTLSPASIVTGTLRT
jgi:hypothetical protein